MQHPEVGKLISIQTEEVDVTTGLPLITSSITIYSNLSCNMHRNGVQLSIKKTANITKSDKFAALGEVLNVLTRVKSLDAGIKDRLETAAKILDPLTDSSIDEEIRLVATFTIEQLRLASKPPRLRRYSPFLLGAAVIWDRISPKLYERLYTSTMLCLPHSKTLRRLTSALQVKVGLESGTMAYLGMRVEKLEPRERIVNLAMDEVYTAQSMELAGGRVYGETAGMITKTLFCTHINAVAGKYEEMVSMLPVPHVTAAGIEQIFNKVLKDLTELGFVVVSVTTDNNRTNQSWHNSLGEDRHHPEYLLNPYSKTEQRVYTLYDTVHIFKNIYYGLMKNQTLALPAFAGSDEPRQLGVNFAHLTRLYSMERGNPGKLAYKLTDQVLKPSVLERVNVGLAAAATHESTTAALRHFSKHMPGCQGFEDTTEFLELVRRWFNICNVKSQYMAGRMNDRNRVAIRSGCGDSDRSLDFLSEFGRYMRSFQDSSSTTSAKISKDTCMGVYHSSRGLVGLAKYLLEKYGDDLNYVLLGKVQSDNIERHFGHLRKISGGNYWSSVRQFMENEAVIRTKSLIWWSGFSPADIARKMAPSQQQHQLEDMEVVESLLETARQAEHEELDDSTKAALGHIAGYLAHSATKSSKCSACADLMVDREATAVDVSFETDKTNDAELIYRSFTQLLDRGKLLVPSPIAITITLDICLIWRWLVKGEDSRHQLLVSSLPRKVFVDVVSRLGSDDAQLTETVCHQGHNMTGLQKRMASALFNLFAGNMVRDMNSDVHAKRKPGATKQQRTRSRCDDKRRAN